MQIAGVPMARYQSSRRKESLPPSRKPTPDFLQPRPFPPIPEAQESAPPSLNPNIPPPQFSIAEPSGSRPQPIQPKLTIGTPGDKYEQEADRVASQVVRQINAPTAAQGHQPQSVQREALPEEDELQMKPMLQRLEMPEEDELQMKSTLAMGVVEGDASPNLESAIQQSRGSGQALAPDLQTKMGQAMGADFSNVRIHTDTQSDQLNRSIQAKAFTTGQDIFFRQGAYQPGNRGGQELIAHELTHVVQQGGHGSSSMESGRISRKLSVQNTQWDQVRQIYSSGKGGGGVLMFADKVGERQIIVKAGVQGAEEVATATLMAGVNKSKDKWNIGTPDVRVLPANEATQASQQMQKRIFQGTVNQSGYRVGKLLMNMQRGNIGDMIVTSLAQGQELGDMLTGSQDQDQITTGDQRSISNKDKVNKDSPLKLFMDNEFMKALGRMAAVDIFLGNWDRLADKFNPENLFVKKNFTGGGQITGIDNSGEQGMLNSQQGDVNTWLQHSTGLPQMMANGDYLKMAHILLVTDDRGYSAGFSPILVTLMGSLLGIDTKWIENSYDDQNAVPTLRTDEGMNDNPQVVAVRDKLNNHMVEMSTYVAQGLEQGFRRLRDLPPLDLTNQSNGGVAQQNYNARLNYLP
jgi:hypothetical protein